MILEELVGVIVSFVSVFVFQAPQISLQDQRRDSAGSTSCENLDSESKWKDVVHREYEREDGRELRQETDYYTSASFNYVSVGSESHIMPSFRQSLQRSLRANLGILLAVIPLGLSAIAFVYFELKTTALCFREHYNNSIPYSVMRWKLIGEDIASISVNIWFPWTLALLVGWKEFKSNYLSTLYIGFAAAAIVVIYKTFLLVFGVFVTMAYYRYPVDAVFFAGIICNNVFVARKFRKVHPSTTYSCFHIFFMISTSFLAGCAIAFIYRYSVVPYFNQQEKEINKVIIAAMTPVVALIPTVICKYFALRQISEMIRPDRRFLLAYFLRGGTISMYRIMQADVKSPTFFVGLSLLHGFSNVFSKATERLREKMWERFVLRLKRTFCCRSLKLFPFNTPHYRRLKTDIEIQDILFEYNTLILSQVYLVLYLVTSFDISPWAVIKRSLIRLAIGLGIDLFFNCISVFIQVHYHDIPMRRVWFKCWKRHVFANAVITMVIVIYCTPGFLTVFQARGDNIGQKHAIKNCTLPFENW